MRIAVGETFTDLGLRQMQCACEGALCRVITEDRVNRPRPDTGHIASYRSSGGAGIRLDRGTV